jgi:type II secretory ATPase GspE/PulE/Tfp pilus assembly ATPase PilB-like protein
MAQRLIRRLCKHCKKAVAVDELEPKMKAQVTKTIRRINETELKRRVSPEILKNPMFYVPV